MIPAIVMGDKTTGGGTVIEGCRDSTVNGKPIARVGDKATCPIKGHGGIVTILEGDPTHIIEGRPAAGHGATLSCGCKAQASQTIYFVEQNSGGKSVRTPATKPTAKDLKNEFNDFYLLRNSQGKIMKSAHYAVKYPDGRIEHGITDASGNTNLHITGEEADTLHFYVQGA